MNNENNETHNNNASIKSKEDLIHTYYNHPNKFIKLYRIHYYDFRNAAYGFILVMIGVLLVQLNVMIEGLSKKLDKTLTNVNSLSLTLNDKVDKILVKTESTMTSIDAAANEFKKVSEAQSVIYTDPETIKGIKVFLRSADDFSRIVDNVLDSSRIVKKDLLPNTNNLLISANGTLLESTKTIRIAGETIAEVSKDGRTVLNESSLAIKQLRTLLEDPKIKEAIAQAVEIEKQSVMLIANGNEILKDLDENTLPSLVSNLKAVGNNTEQSSNEVLTFLKGLNKPTSKKEKIARFFLESLLKSAPVLLRR